MHPSLEATYWSHFERARWCSCQDDRSVLVVSKNDGIQAYLVVLNEALTSVAFGLVQTDTSV